MIRIFFEKARKQRGEARWEETTHSAEEGVTEKHARTDKSDTEMDTKTGGEVDTSQSHSRHKKGYMTKHSLVDQQVMDKFVQMKIMLSVFLGPRQESTRTAFCNCLTSELEALEGSGFQTFRNEAVKLLSGMQSKSDERTRQPPTSVVVVDDQHPSPSKLLIFTLIQTKYFILPSVTSATGEES